MFNKNNYGKFIFYLLCHLSSFLIDIINKTIKSSINLNNIFINKLIDLLL